MTAIDLVARTEHPPFDILRSGFAELAVTDLGVSEHFYCDLLGLNVSDRDEGRIYLRGWEERAHHSLILRQADRPGALRLAFRVRTDRDLELLAEEFTGRGCAIAWDERAHIGVGRMLRVTDPFGFPLGFYHEMEQVQTQLQRFDIQRGAPIMRMDHFNVHTPDLEAMLTYLQDLGFRCSEYIATEGESERITGAWMMRKPSVHDIALTAGRGPRLHHVGLFVAEPAGVLRACDQLAAAGHSEAIERGPGRHGVSNAFFVYLRDPDGHRIELYACDYYTGDPDHQPLRWSVRDPRCRSFWGTAAPDSWYDESSELIGADGAAVPTTAANVDERVARSEVMS